VLGAPGALSYHPVAGLGKPIASGVRILRGFTAARSWGVPHAGCCWWTNLHHTYVSPGQNYERDRTDYFVSICRCLSLMAGSTLPGPDRTGPDRAGPGRGGTGSAAMLGSARSRR